MGTALLRQTKGDGPQWGTLARFLWYCWLRLSWS